MKLKINNVEIGDGCKPFIIAEIGINHMGSVEIAKQLIDAAKQSGADAVKFQKRETTKILTKKARDKPYGGYSSFGDTYGEHRNFLELSRDAYKELKKYSEDKKLIFFASPWDETSADFLEELGVQVFKIASADLTNLPLLEHVARICARMDVPVILSTGMSNFEEIDEAVKVFKDCDLIIMQCTSTYPCEMSDINLLAMQTIMKRYGKLVGYSSHESSIIIPVVAVVMGACVIEKHFTLNKTWKGSDQANSLEPEPFRKMVRDINEALKAMGNPEKKLLPPEIPIRQKLAKSIVSTQKIYVGQALQRHMLTTKSPGDGMAPKEIPNILGKRAAHDIEEDTTLKPEDLIL